MLGFHATGTLGSFGAAAACAHLLGLDAEKFATALGIAGTQAAGLKSMFGTMCKPLHAGKAAYHGLLAARLAQRGFTSRGDVLECAQGFARTHSPDFNPAEALAEPPGGFHIRNNLFKYHAACYMTHAPIEAARKLREQHGLTTRAASRASGCASMNLRPYLQHSRAAHRPGGEVQPAAHHRDGARRRRYRRARQLLGGDRCRSHAGRAARQGGVRLPAAAGRTRCADLELVLTDGRRVATSHDAGVPASDIDEQGGRLAEKFTSLAEPILGGAKTRDLIGEIGRLDDSVRPARR